MVRQKREKRAGAAQVAAFPSRLGWMTAQWHADRLCRLVFGCATKKAALARLGTPESPAKDRSALMRETISRLQCFAQGQVDPFQDIILDLDERTEFHRDVVRHCRQIPPGETMTYGQLAAKVGSGQAARAVGTVMATNRIPLIVPCHRVVRAGGALGGYSAPDGLRMKKRLLRMEGWT